MCNRNEVAALPLPVVLVAALLWLPLAVRAGRVELPKPPVIEREAPAAPGYQVRCWQYGRLLFEERGVELGGSALQGLQLSGLDRRRLPLMVTDTGNATCLVRRMPAPRPGRVE